MRSTRGKTRKSRKRLAPRITDIPVIRSNSGNLDIPGSPRANSGKSDIEAIPGQGRRTGWDSDINTNTRLKDGGISSFYRSREGKGQK